MSRKYHRRVNYTKTRRTDGLKQLKLIRDDYNLNDMTPVQLSKKYNHHLDVIMSILELVH